MRFTIQGIECETDGTARRSFELSHAEALGRARALDWRLREARRADNPDDRRCRALAEEALVAWKSAYHWLSCILEETPFRAAPVKARRPARGKR